MQVLNLQDILELPKYSRINLINTISGPRSGNLIGTTSTDGIYNLAIFNTVTHIGASPPLLGFIMRPLTVERHTYDNIKATGFYTINPINTSIYKAAHQTSAKYTSDISEFEAVGLQPEMIHNFKAPFVKESTYGIAMSYKEEYPIKSNGTVLIIGQIEHIILPQNGLTDDYSLNHDELDTVAIGGLDTYYQTSLLDRLKYARP